MPSPVPAAAIVRVGTLSKTLGSLGGFVAASGDVIDLLINRARPFIFSTGLTPRPRYPHPRPRGGKMR